MSPCCQPKSHILRSSGKQPEQSNLFVKAIQAQVQDAKPQAKQAPKPSVKPGDVQRKRPKKFRNPDGSSDRSSPYVTSGADDSQDDQLPVQPPQRKKSKVKPKDKKPFKKTKKADGASKQFGKEEETESVSTRDKWKAT